MILACALLLATVPSFAFASDNSDPGFFIATSECPTGYIEYASENLSNFIMSLPDKIDYDDIYVGTPFSFADADADVYYFPVFNNETLTYLYRVYPDGNTYSATISSILADDLDQLAMLTSANRPMYLNLVDSQIIATIGIDK